MKQHILFIVRPILFGMGVALIVLGVGLLAMCEDEKSRRKPWREFWCELFE